MSVKGLASKSMEKNLFDAFLLATNSSLDIVFELLKNLPESNNQIFIYCSRFTDSQKKELDKLGCKYSSDIQFVAFNLSNFEVVITLGALPHTSHLRIAYLCSAFKQMGGTVIDLQHGLFQWGINFTDSSLEQSYESVYGKGISMPIKTIADIQLYWFGEGGLGYPGTNKVSEYPNLRGDYVLISSNTNWHIYSNEEKIKFAKLVTDFIRLMPHLNFVWKPHPAEFNRKISPILNYFDLSKYHNLEIVSHGDRGNSLMELVAGCLYGISTVGTAIMDYQSHAKPCFIFHAQACESLLAEFDEVSTFNKVTDLNYEPKVPVYRDMKPFDFEKFWEVVASNRKKLSNVEELKIMLNVISRLEK